MHLQITHLGTEFSCSDEELLRLRAAFEHVHCLQLPRFLSPPLLATVQQHLSAAATVSAAYDGVGSETRVEFGGSTAALDLAINDPVLYDALRRLTGIERITNFGGRVYEKKPGEQGFQWHDDNVQNRVLGLSLNLGTDPFRGGVLQLAAAGNPEILCEVANIVPGDAVIFRIGPNVMHRVTPIEGPSSRVAYPGWFRSEPSYEEFLRERWSRIAAAREAVSS